MNQSMAAAAGDRDLQESRILLVDDQPANLEIVCDLLESQGCRISMAPDGATALRIAAQTAPDLILLDVVMPGMDGFAVCRRLKQNPELQHIPVIFITAKDVREGVVEGFQAGGVDYITKPFQDAEVLVRVRTHLRLNRLRRELAAKNAELEQRNRDLQQEMAQRKALKGRLSMLSQREAERWGLEGFIGRSPTIQRIFKEIHLLQESATTSVLIAGESGTGKELIARALHCGSARASGPFVPINCAAIPGELIEALLFGHVRGAFTGAEADQIGYFQMAHEGTLFLDEIGEMSLDLQAKLLRLLEDGEVRRIGAKEGRKLDVRILAATNVDLPQRMERGTFRRDLYFRLARFTVTAPPLQQRKEDIPLLAQHFLHLFAGEMGCEPVALNAAVLEALKAYSFPGNVRELKNIIERALIESRGGELQPAHLHFLPPPAAAPPIAAPTALPLDLQQAELWVVKRAIELAGGNISEAARQLRTNRNRIYRVLARESGV